jgi:CheY-like chemotaxis protein
MRKLNILLAEDDEIIERVTTFYLRRNGHEVDVAKNGYEAVSKFKVKEYDLVLMDIQMPGMDGLQAVKQIRGIEMNYHTNGHTTIIAITTNPDKAECFEAGVDGYAQKPIGLKELTESFGDYNLV